MLLFRDNKKWPRVYYPLKSDQISHHMHYTDEDISKVCKEVILNFEETYSLRVHICVRMTIWVCASNLSKIITVIDFKCETCSVKTTFISTKCTINRGQLKSDVDVFFKFHNNNKTANSQKCIMELEPFYTPPIGKLILCQHTYSGITETFVFIFTFTQFVYNTIMFHLRKVFFSVFERVYKRIGSKPIDNHS